MTHQTTGAVTEILAAHRLGVANAADGLTPLYAHEDADDRLARALAIEPATLTPTIRQAYDTGYYSVAHVTGQWHAIIPQRHDSADGPRWLGMVQATDGHVTEADECPEWHPTHLAALECAERVARERNAEHDPGILITPAEPSALPEVSELRHAAHSLRTPDAGAFPLAVADWLDAAAERLAGEPRTIAGSMTRNALAVARSV